MSLLPMKKFCLRAHVACTRGGGHRFSGRPPGRSQADGHRPPRKCCISSDTEEASPAAIAETPKAAAEFKAQVHDWRFSELRSTDLAALREDVSARP